MNVFNMKFYFIFVYIIFFTIVIPLELSPLKAQIIKQHGITYKYNGKNVRIPIGGVYIKAAAAVNHVISEEPNGNFEINFQNLKIGEPVGKVIIAKKGMMVFNQQAIDEWNIREMPLKVILCDVNEFQKQKEKLVFYGREQSSKEYERKIRDLEQLYSEKKLELDQFYALKDSLEQELQNVHRHMEEYADIFARIDESEVDTLAQQAIDLFNKGELEKAVKILEEANYLKKLFVDNKAIELLERNKQELIKKREKHIANILVQIQAYKLNGNWYKAKSLQKSMADSLGDFKFLYDYGKLCYELKSYIESEVYLSKALKKVQSQKPSLESLFIESLVKQDIAIIYKQNKEYRKAESLQKEIILMRKRLCAERPNVFDLELAMAVNNLASLYMENGEEIKSQKYFQQSLDIYESSEIKDERILSGILSNYAGLLVQINDYEKAENIMDQVLDIERSNPMPSCLDSFVKSLYNMAIIYAKMENYKKSKELNEEALEKCKILAIQNPYANIQLLAMIYCNLANDYKRLSDFDKSERFYEEAIKIQKKQAEENFTLYARDLAITLSGIGQLYSFANKNILSEKYYLESLDIIKKTGNSFSRMKEEANILFLLGCMYGVHGKYSEAEVALRESSHIYSKLCEHNFDLYSINLQKALYALFAVSQAEGKNDSCLAISKKILLINDAYFQKRVIVNDTTSIDYLLNIANVLRTIKEYKESELVYNKLLLYLKSFAKNLDTCIYVKQIEVLGDFALLKFYIKQYGQSIKMLEKSIEMLEKDTDVLNKNIEMYNDHLFNLALIYAYNKDGKKASNTIKKLPDYMQDRIREILQSEEKN